MIRAKPTRKRRAVKRAPKLSTLENALWRAFSLWIRLRDGGNCLMGKDARTPCQGPLQAGHVIQRRFRSTRYDEHNVFAQCAFHNKGHKYNPHPYVAWYVRTFGQQAYDALEARSARLGKRPTRQEYAALIARYSAPSFAPGTSLGRERT
jgi:hypothetical protein